MQHRSHIILKKGRDESARRFHPWIFSGAIDKVSGKIEEGDPVDVLDNSGNYIGTGHAATGSIAVKLFWFGPSLPPDDIWYTKLLRAFKLREVIGYAKSNTHLPIQAFSVERPGSVAKPDSGEHTNAVTHPVPQTPTNDNTKYSTDNSSLSSSFDNNFNNTYRLVFSEADGLPGLIIDFYNGVAVIQLHSMGMHLIRSEITDALIKLYGNQLLAVYSKSSETLSRSGIGGVKDEFLYKKKSQEGGEMVFDNDHIVTENGRRFHIDFIEGQKTGFFLDQRENRALLAHYAPGKKILNAFSYSGGFSIYALTTGAGHVTSLDSSAKAMVLLEKNLLLNQFDGSHSSVTADAKIWLPEMDKDFDIIVLDPPAFAKRQADRHKALQGYRFINQTAIKNIKSGGLLFTFSCSQAISTELFTSAIMSAALDTGRNARILHHLTHSPDHPVSIFHPEGEYLKGLVLLID
jgi:23S rRNA (cytosine1962-C5)-methyltransferase